MTFLDHYDGTGRTPEEKLDSWLAIGPPEAVAKKLNVFIEAGWTTPILRFTTSDQRGQLERCLAEVLPKLQYASRIGLGRDRSDTDSLRPW